MLKWERAKQSESKKVLSMKEEVFVVGDVHGEITLLKKLLEKWDREKQQLIFIGDLGDRGENSKACFLLAKELVEKYGAIYLKGNHEDMLLRFIGKPEEFAGNYFLNGGLGTLESFLHERINEEYSPTEIALMMKHYYKNLFAFLAELPLYYEWEQYVFVHAGVDLGKKDWHDSTEEDFLWIREPFHKKKNRTGKTIVFGHTPTFYLHGDNDRSDLWISDDKIGIDGGAVYGGSLHGVVFDKNGLKEDHIIQK